MQERIDGIVVRGSRRPRSSPKNPKTKARKKPKKLQEFAEKLEGYEFEFFKDMEIAVIKDLKEEISTLEDERDESYVWHKLEDVILITLFAVMANCDDWYQIPMFAEAHREWFETFLSLPNGIPTENTIKIIISKIDPNKLYGLVVSFLINRIENRIRGSGTADGGEMRGTGLTENDGMPGTDAGSIGNDVKADEKGLINLDGKASRSSKRKATDQKEGQAALNTLNAYSSDYGMTIAQEFIPDKKSEIEYAPKLLGNIDIQGAIVTADSLNTQTKTVEAIIAGGADYVLPVKGNHPTLHGDLQVIFDERRLDDIRNDENNNETYTCTEEREHGETVKRECFLIPKVEGLYKAESWDGLETIGLVHKTVTKTDQKTKTPINVYEDRFYISSVLSITDFSRATRGHWAVEGLHWHLDYTFHDDQNKTTAGNGAEGLQIFKKLALNILKMAQAVNPKRMSIRKLRFMLSLSYEDMISNILSLLAV